MSNPAQLLAAAKKATRSTGGNISVKKWTPVIIELRSKNFTWQEIWQWLKDQGEAVQPNWRTFAAGASRIHSNYLRTLAKGDA